MEVVQGHEMSPQTRDTLLVFGGVALVLLGAGMVLSSHAGKKYLSEVNFGNLLARALPELQRNLKL